MIKILLASWLIELYNYMTSSAGREVCMKGLPSLESFKDIDPLVENKNLMNMTTYYKSSLDERQYCLEKYETGSEPECKGDVGNIFICNRFT